jgi:phosphate-selective porin OprO/OprP
VKIFFTRLLATANFLLFLTSAAKAQHSDMVDSTQTQVFSDSGKSYFIPDLSREQHMGWTKGGNQLLTWQLGFVPILDYNLNIQNEQSEKQVGGQESRFDIRSARFSVRGNLNFKKNPWSYMISMEYKGLDRNEDDDPFGFTDIKFSIPIGKKLILHLARSKKHTSMKWSVMPPIFHTRKGFSIHSSEAEIPALFTNTISLATG